MIVINSAFTFALASPSVANLAPSGAILGTLMENAPYAKLLRESAWLYPLVESAHILAFAILIGILLFRPAGLLGRFTAEKV